MNPSDLKNIVKKKYSEIATASGSDESQSCCSGASCSQGTYTVFSEDYSHLDGYNPDADLSLGCGIPVEFAMIKPGDHILDLGSGAGNDCFVARAQTGEEGQVTGIDFTEAMVAKAEENRKRHGYTNVRFVIGDIEEMPLPDNSFNVVVSNCVLNLVPDKRKAFGEIMRVLKPGGHFCVSDVVIRGTLSERVRTDAELYAGCVAGASSIDEYLEIVRQSGFTGLTIHKEKRIELPDNILSGKDDKSGPGVFSITVSACKPQSVN